VSDLTPSHQAYLDAFGLGPNSPALAPKPAPSLWTPSRFNAEWATVRPKMEPRLHQAYDYQEGALTAIRASLAAGNMHPMVMSPTGSGKTVIAEHAIAMQLLGEALVRKAVETGRVAFVVPRLELIRQTVDRFRDVGLTDIGVVQGRHALTNPHARIQICSAQTLSGRELPDVDLVIVDEAHLMHKSIFRWMKDKPDLRFIGLSATPWAQGLGKYYDDLIIVATIADLIEKERLCDFKVYSHGMSADLSSVKTVAGEFHQAQLGEAMDTAVLVGDVVKTWIEKGENRPTFLFAVNCDHARHLYECFVEAGVGAAYMDGETLPDPDRKEIFKRFRSGEVKVICSVGVLTTGVDEDVRCIIDAQPTRSQILHVQKIGRGLRTAPGKDFLLILDHAGNHLRLGKVTDIFHGKLHDGTPKAEKERKAEKGEPLPKLCPACKSVISRREETCPECGHAFTAYTKVRHRDGDLVLLGSGEQGRIGATEEERKTFYRECLGYCEDRGWKPGAAYHKFKGKYPNEEPKRQWQLLEPLTPTLATINELKRQYIAWRASGGGARS
jgi:DNA repair protein RadD